MVSSHVPTLGGKFRVVGELGIATVRILRTALMVNAVPWGAAQGGKRREGGRGKGRANALTYPMNNTTASAIRLPTADLDACPLGSARVSTSASITRRAPTKITARGAQVSMIHCRILRQEWQGIFFASAK